jgi:hypothetical protein
MFTFVTAAAMGLLWLLAIGWAIITALCAFIVLWVLRDVYRTIKLKQQRRNGMQ